MKKQFKSKKINPSKIIESFKNCTNKDEVNFVHANGSIFEVGGILSKLDSSGNQFFAINGKWVPAFT